MAHKTFISYKYSDVVENRGRNNLRDRIISAMGEDAQFYNGERIDSPDMSDLKAETIKSNLKDMIFNTSVTIVILSPKMLESKWIPWEIEYSLSCYSRDGRQSKQNGVVAVIQKVNGGYSWLTSTGYDAEKGMNLVTYDSTKLPAIINKNMFNSVPPRHPCKNCLRYTGYSVCAECTTFDALKGSYISVITEDVFLKDINKYIENAYDKSQRLEWFYTHKKIA